MMRSREEARLQSTYKLVQPWLLQPKVFESARHSVDKAFCSVSRMAVWHPFDEYTLQQHVYVMRTLLVA